MRVLLAYKSTTRTMRRLARTLALQSRLSISGAEFSHIIVTDPDSNGIAGYPILRAPLWEHGKLNYSAFRNAAFAHAEKAGFDWIVDAGADSAFCGRMSPPPSGVARIPTYYAREADTADDICNALGIEDGLSFSQSSYLVISRRVFTTTVFNPSFLGYGWEDRDYIENVLPSNGFQLGETDLRAIHCWHPTEAKNVDPNDFERNRLLFVSHHKALAEATP